LDRPVVITYAALAAEALLLVAEEAKRRLPGLSGISREDDELLLCVCRIWLSGDLRTGESGRSCEQSPLDQRRGAEAFPSEGKLILFGRKM